MKRFQVKLSKIIKIYQSYIEKLYKKYIEKFQVTLGKAKILYCHYKKKL